MCYMVGEGSIAMTIALYVHNDDWRTQHANSRMMTAIHAEQTVLRPATSEGRRNNKNGRGAQHPLVHKWSRLLLKTNHLRTTAVPEVAGCKEYVCTWKLKLFINLHPQEPR